MYGQKVKYDLIRKRVKEPKTSQFFTFRDINLSRETI